MKSKMKCEVVRDLLPLYVEKLTNDKTNEEMKLHLEECTECRIIEESMQKDIEGEVNVEKKEVDFLKKVKKNTRKRVMAVFGGFIILVLAFLFIKINFIGTLEDAEEITVEKVTVAGKSLSLHISGPLMVRTKVTENNGEVIVKVYTSDYALTGATIVDINKEFNNEISKVEIKGITDVTTVVYEGDTQIDAAISKIYNNRIEIFTTFDEHAGIGDNLHYVMYYGNCLVTFSVEMYKKDGKKGIKCYVDESEQDIEGDEWKEIGIDKATMEVYEAAMKEYTIYNLACIDDLEMVKWDVNIGGRKKEYTFTTEDMSEYLDMDIKEFGKTVHGLQKIHDALEMKFIEMQSEKK